MLVTIAEQVMSGILKNSSSYQHISPETRVSPTSERPSFAQPHDSPSTAPVPSGENSRPSLPNRELSEKEITQLNTERNAGEHRRTSSNPRASVSRRQSSQSGEASGVPGESEQGQRLKWDEANLYLNEGQMGGKMKIDEPKTPFVHSQDLPDREEEEETTSLNPQDLAVDELEMDKSRLKSKKSASAAQDEIPDIDIGQPEMEMEMQTEPAPSLPRRESDGLDRKVSLGGDPMDLDGMHHGEHEEAMTGAELEKHKKFEEMRKRHYEMKNIKDLLGHPEVLDEDEDEEGKR
ncbi:hypothetical protein B0A55_11898 [Friedmanniomyces simplex]|uniref:Glc8 protein n=1 Tax=Friedmanniomyces simplex TaxID=329884 RepID=A0A4U0W7C3_9PEZI|nr:hypothetical protein B0A55_11898 [Friedmanniomyces simplex]